MEQYQRKINEQLDKVDTYLRRYPQVKSIEEKTKVRPAHIALGVVALLVLFVLFGVGQNALCNLIGFAYPVYASFKAVKTDDKADDKQWLTYWIVFGFFGLIESFTDFFLYWIPFYFLAKMAFLIWLYYPETKGAGIVFDKVIDPILMKYQPRIDSGLSSASRIASQAGQAAQTAKKMYEGQTEGEPGAKKQI